MAKNAGRSGPGKNGARRRTPTGDENLHSGGARGSSRQGGPGGDVGDKEPRIRDDDDAGLRSSPGRPDPGERSGVEEDRDTEPLRGTLPAGTVREDYVGGERPHKTRQKGGTAGASGRRNEVI
ncbi:MAG TPA: hypothetical protein VLL75_19515 [Vicinamibacteria bacterium]|nr:hypothetical protein [Vicinamibacteria bacterium]